MQKLFPLPSDGGSADDTYAANIARLRALFPELVTEGKQGVSVNVDVLKQLVGDHTLTDTDERYGLGWFGKRSARKLALTPSLGTLRPAPDESVDWETTKNLMIEGDNLEVLKLLQKSYAGKVKLIYIDPPYNTGDDFVYPDNFRDSLKNYQEITGQVEDGKRTRSSQESSGRIHTDWLNMIYPRLKLARNLLGEDGVIFISIDDGESANLKKTADEIFGEENFLPGVVWHKKRGKDNSAQFFSKVHDYILCYAKSASTLRLSRLELDEETKKAYRNPDNDPRGVYRSLGLWARGGQGGSRFEFTSKKGQFFTEREWLVGPDKMREYDAEDRLVTVGDKLYRKLFLTENEGSIPETIWTDASNNANAADELKVIFGNNPPFDTPKPIPLIEKMIRLASKDDSIVMDFFAGSGTVGHAVMVQNAKDQGKRRYILVQLPEKLDSQKKEQQTASNFCDSIGKPRSIAELTKERLRRAAKKARDEYPLFTHDLGFRVFKLDTSNINVWNPDPQDLEKTLFDHTEHLKADRSEQDILYEIMLKRGIDLCAPSETREITGKTVSALNGGLLIACLAKAISAAEAETLAEGIVEWHKVLSPTNDTTCVFRDGAFENDVAKANLAAILEQNGIKNVRSL